MMMRQGLIIQSINLFEFLPKTNENTNFKPLLPIQQLSLIEQITRSLHDLVCDILVKSSFLVIYLVKNFSKNSTRLSSLPLPL